MISRHIILLALLIWGSKSAPKPCRSKAIFVVWQARNARTRLSFIPGETLDELEARVHQRFKVKTTGGIAFLGRTDAASEQRVVCGGVYQVAPPRARDPKQTVAAAPSSLAVDAASCADSFDNCLEPQTWGPLLFRQGIEVLTEHGKQVKYIEYFRNQDPVTTAQKWCVEYNVGECQPLEAALKDHLNRRILDEERWSQYDGQGFIEMLMW